MRLETLRLTNFRGYVDREFVLHPQFNLVVGENGAGKTSFLEAAAVAVGSWLLGFPGHDSRNIRARDVRRLLEFVERRYRELPQHPVRVQATGFIHVARVERDDDGAVSYSPVQTPGKKNPREIKIRWERSIEARGGKTTTRGAKELKELAAGMASQVLKRDPRILPLIRYFGAGRLWESVRDTEGKALSKHKGKQPSDLAEDAEEIEKLMHEAELLSEPFYGYRMSVDKRCNPEDLIRWMAVERHGEIDDEEPSPALRLVYQAIEVMLPEIASARYSTALRTLVLKYKGSDERHTFSELSDGYRNVVAISADLAIKAAMLNPQLAEKALQMTPGVVLIDELDLHLHPKWQRRIVSDLRRTFPLVQFICTTHSPFLIQALRSGEELIVLDGQPTSDLGHMPVEEIAKGIMGVANTEVSEDYESMKQVAKSYLETLELAAMAPQEKQQEFQRRLAEAIAPYAHNPAYQAFLEMKRVAKLGE